MKLKKLRLSEISKERLAEQEMRILFGGGTPGNCQCGCLYANSGGSSSASNDSANNAFGYSSYDGGSNYGGSQTFCQPPTQTNCHCAAQSTLCGETQHSCWV